MVFSLVVFPLLRYLSKTCVTYFLLTKALCVMFYYLINENGL